MAVQIILKTSALYRQYKYRKLLHFIEILEW